MKEKDELELREKLAERGMELTPDQVHNLIFEVENLPHEEWTWANPREENNGFTS
jgi:hypothetical protein